MKGIDFTEEVVIVICGIATGNSAFGFLSLPGTRWFEA
jgi:hypothetical protein